MKIEELLIITLNNINYKILISDKHECKDIDDARAKGDKSYLIKNKYPINTLVAYGVSSTRETFYGNRPLNNDDVAFLFPIAFTQHNREYRCCYTPRNHWMCWHTVPILSWKCMIHYLDNPHYVILIASPE